MKEFSEILYSKAKWITTITINRTTFFNSLSIKALEELIKAFKKAEEDGLTSIIILTGSGDNYFCTGCDLREFFIDFKNNPALLKKWITLYVDFIRLINNCSKPVITKVNGIVSGGGCDIIFSSDFAIASESAIIKQTGTTLGNLDIFGSAQLFPLYLGEKKAKEILLLGETLKSSHALKYGIYNVVTPKFDVGNKTNDLVQRLVTKLSENTRITKQFLNSNKDFFLNIDLKHAIGQALSYIKTEEYAACASAFIEKRQPDYMGLRNSYVINDNKEKSAEDIDFDFEEELNSKSPKRTQNIDFDF